MAWRTPEQLAEDWPELKPQQIRRHCIAADLPRARLSTLAQALGALVEAGLANAKEATPETALRALKQLDAMIPTGQLPASSAQPVTTWEQRVRVTQHGDPAPAAAAPPAPTPPLDPFD